MKPEITVVITTYKRPVEVVMRAVDSVLRQTFENFELLIIDDSPNEYCGREEVAQAIAGLGDKRIRYIQQEKNMGACIARNRGITEARAEYICFLDDDDEHAEDKLQLQYDAIKRMDVGLVTCRTKIVNDVTGKEKHSRKKTYNGYVYKKLICSNFMPLSAPLLKKECFEQCGMFNPEMPASQDIEMWLRITKKYPIYVIEKELYIQHIHSGERLTTNPQKKLIGIQKVMEYNMEYLQENVRVYSIFLFRQVKYYIWLKDFKMARRYFGKAFKKYPLNIMKYLPYTLFWMIKYGRK